MKVDRDTSPQSETSVPSPKITRPPSVERRAGSALFWNVAFLPLKAGLSLFVNLLIVKSFSLNSYDSLAIITAFQATLGLYVDLGIERALPRFVGQIERDLGRGALRRFLFTITLVKLAILTLFIVGVTIFADGFISLFLSRVPASQGRQYLALIAILLVLGAIYDICTQVLYSFFKQKVTNLLDIVVTILNPLLTIFLVIWPFRLEVYGVILSLLITTVISVGIACWQAYLASREAAEIAHYEREKTQTNQPPATKQSIWGRFTRYALLMYFFNFSTWLADAPFAILVFSNQLVTVALIRLSYSFIKQLLKMLLTPFQGVQTPLFSSIHAEGPTGNGAVRLQAAYSSLSKLQIFILLPSAVGAIVLARNLVQLLFPRTSREAVLTYDNLNLAVWVTGLTVLFTFAESLISLPMVILQVYERYRLVVISRLMPVAGGILLLVAAFLNWNAIAAVCIMGSMAVGSRLVALLIVRREMGLHFPLAFLWKVGQASLAFGIPLGIAVYFLPINWPITFAAALLGVIIFVAVFRRLGGFDPEDKARLMNLRLPFRKYLVKWL